MKTFLLQILVPCAADYAGVLLAISADLVSGLSKARREGKACTSHGLRQTVAKISSSYTALFSLTAVDAMLVAAIYALRGLVGIPPFPFLTTLGAIALAVIEVKSICENSPHNDAFRRAAKLLLTIFRTVRR